MAEPLTHSRDPALERPTSPTLLLGQLSPPASLRGTDTDMSSQEVTYCSLRFLQSPLESQNTLRPGGTQRPGKTDDKEFSVPWHPFVVTLGILCLLLLVTVTVLGTMIFQCFKEKHQQEEILRKLIPQYDSIRNNNYSKEQLLINKTLECDILKNQTLHQKKELDSLFMEKMRCHIKQEIFSKSLQSTGKFNEDHWFCCGVNCYYFTSENENWMGCKETCQRYNLSLLKIDDEDKLNFVQRQTYRDSYWIGLSYNATESKWKWIDSGMSSGIFTHFQADVTVILK
ncbi:killer cell lectin-like receptor isoform X2 [Equus caballus]|uniref:killer cell lectin-like receptor isoform X2 n=1 Tax=Equus caballus TaxID=9796 RepID=UPI0038B31CFD